MRDLTDEERADLHEAARVGNFGDDISEAEADERWERAMFLTERFGLVTGNEYLALSDNDTHALAVYAWIINYRLVKELTRRIEERKANQ